MMHLFTKLLGTIWLGLLGLFSSNVWADEPSPWQTNMTRGVTDVAAQVYDLHMIILWICVIIGIGVFAVMMFSIFYHRKSRGHKPATFHENITLELVWTIVPFVILIAMAFPATKVLLNIYDNDDAELDIIVTGYQWKWRYEYLDDNGDSIAFFSNLRTPREEIYEFAPKGQYYLLEVDEPVVIPVNKKVRFLVTANDVIHSWWVPALAVKKDAIPGFINEAWTKANRTGVYHGQCAELCGRDHAFMPIVVNVVEEDEYQDWLAGKQAQAAELKELMNQQFTLDEQIVAGEIIYQRSCAACHGMSGEGGIGPAVAGSPVATGPLNEHLDVVVNGVPGTAMQAFGNQLNDIDLAAVITFQRNAFNNNMGDIVQPIDIYQFKQAGE